MNVIKASEAIAMNRSAFNLISEAPPVRESTVSGFSSIYTVVVRDDGSGGTMDRFVDSTEQLVTEIFPIANVRVRASTPPFDAE